MLCLLDIGSVWLTPRLATPNPGRANILVKELLSPVSPARGVKSELRGQYFGVARLDGLQSKGWPILPVNAKILVR
jgi:hypothetical protein